MTQLEKEQMALEEKKNQTNYPNWYFKEDTYITNKYIKRCSALLINKMWIKTTIN